MSAGEAEVFDSGCSGAMSCSGGSGVAQTAQTLLSVPVSNQLTAIDGPTYPRNASIARVRKSRTLSPCPGVSGGWCWSPC